MKNIYNFIRKLPPINNIIRKIKPAGLKETINYLIKDKENPVIIDVGANRGQSIELFLSINNYSTIYAFEPTNSIFSELIEKFSTRKNIFLFNLALGDENKRTTLFTSEDSLNNSLLKFNLENIKTNKPEISSLYDICSPEEIQLMRFDNWYRENTNIDKIEMFKVDTQGNDYNVLRGCGELLSKAIKIVIIEIQFHNLYEGMTPFYKSFELLYSSGFKLYNFIPSARKNRIEILEADCVFINEHFLP